jgi:hypothetical protein
MRITVYESTDGEIFRTQAEFMKHEEMLKIKPAVTDLVNKTTLFTCDGGAFDADMNGNKCLYPDDVPGWVIQNADVLRNILNNSITLKRGPKPKDAHK